MPGATFRFYEELNDFLPVEVEERKKDLWVSFPDGSTLKEVLASLGVPHSEVDFVLVNGEAEDFSYLLEGGERISIYPVFESLDIRPIRGLGPDPLRRLRFVADVQLGRLAKYLRLFGFDTLYDRDADSRTLIQVAVQQGRVLLTRNRSLIKDKAVTRGILVRESDPRAQLKRIFQRLDLSAEARPFSRCLRCNGPVRPIPREEVDPGLPERVLANCRRFTSCSFCHRVYWEGSHFERMSRFVEKLLEGGARSSV